MRYVVALTSEFDYLPYDKEEIIEELKRYSYIKRIKESYNFGMNNQPKVISFTVNPFLTASDQFILETQLNELLGTKYVRIDEKCVGKY